MNKAEEIIKDLIKTKMEMSKLLDLMNKLEDSLLGLEFKYNDDYASIVSVDGNCQKVSLYIEDEKGNNNSIIISLSELLGLITFFK